MPLAPAEYRDHLKKTGLRAGFEFAEIALPAEHDVQLDPLKMHYLEWGRKGAPTILFLHGGGLNAHTWDLCCQALKDDYHCIALDQRGHGDTDWAADHDYSLASQVRDVEQFVEKLGLDRFILIGMSMGAICSLAYAPRHVERLAALVTVDAGPNMGREGGKRIRDFVTSFSEVSTLDSIIERAMSFNPKRDPETLRRSLMHNLCEMPDGNWRWKYDRKRYTDRDEPKLLAEREALWDGVPAIICPALVVRGGESDVFLEEDAARLAATFPHASRATIPGAGHTVQGDNPKDLVAALRAFFAEAGVAA